MWSGKEPFPKSSELRSQGAVSQESFAPGAPVTLGKGGPAPWHRLPGLFGKRARQWSPQMGNSPAGRRLSLVSSGTTDHSKDSIPKEEMFRPCQVPWVHPNLGHVPGLIFPNSISALHDSKLVNETLKQNPLNNAEGTKPSPRAVGTWTSPKRKAVLVLRLGSVCSLLPLLQSSRGSPNLAVNYVAKSIVLVLFYT